MKWFALAIVVSVACRGTSEEPRRAPKATGSAPLPRPDHPVTTDPWLVTSSSDVPSLPERHALADKVCPKVTAPYFYAVEKAGKVSHLLGTRHIGVALAKMPANVLEALHAAKLVVFEISPDDTRRPPRHPDVAVADELGPDLWNHYSELVGSDMAREQATGRPASALLMMMVMYEDPSSMLEQDIENEIRDAHTPVGGLETHVFQDAVLEKLLDMRALRGAVAQTKDRKKLEHESARDLGEYCAGTDDSPGTDADARADMLAAGYTNAEVDAIDEQLVFSRNRDWIPKLEKMFETDHTVIVVGADHLIGKRGVVALLQARGYSVARVAP